jgi:chorismate mutase
MIYKDLLEFRNELDVIDNELVQLLLKRFEISSKVGELKRRVGNDYFDPLREREILNRITNKVDDNLVEIFENIFYTILDGSKYVQKISDKEMIKWQIQE